MKKCVGCLTTHTPDCQKSVPSVFSLPSLPTLSHLYTYQHQPTPATTHATAHTLPTHAHHNTNTTIAHPPSVTTKHMPTNSLPHAPRQHSHTTTHYPYTPQPVGLHPPHIPPCSYSYTNPMD